MAKNAAQDTTPKASFADISDALLKIINGDSQPESEAAPFLSWAPLNASELQEKLKQMGYKVSASQLKQLLRKLDIDQLQTNEDSVLADPHDRAL